MDMPAKILRRCTICKIYHASYLVDDPELGKCYLCLRCWKARSAEDEQQNRRGAENSGATTEIHLTNIETPQSSGKN
jgi:hypothetical protein